MTGDASRKVCLPLPQRVVLSNFSLYRRQKTIEADFDKPVFCLAGANGLGKSTFLAAVNYAITGVVNEHDRRFLGPQDYYDEVQAYARSFFDGRIRQGDHDAAQVELSMRVGDRDYRLVRGMFAPTALRELTITGPGGETEDFSDEAFDDHERHDHYVRNVLADSGLEEFSQLAFLQLFVLTFDEARQLLFWDERRGQSALFIAFGGSAETARAVEKEQRTIDSADSLVRNLQWQATGIREQLKALLAAQAGADTADADLEAEHERLDARVAGSAEAYERLSTEATDKAVRLADSTARLSSTQAEYERLYADRLGRHHDVDGHPVVLETLEEGRCALCATAGDPVVEAVRSALANRCCPLCASALPEDTGDESDAGMLKRLGALATEIEALENEVGEHRQATARLSQEAEQAEAVLLRHQAELDQFRVANSLTLGTTATDANALGAATATLERQVNELLTRKEKERERRESAKARLRAYQADLLRLYAAVEESFVPTFQQLAYEFLGVELEVDLDRRASSLQLRLSLANSDRRQPDELSESQRFFIDIALRMALAKQISAPGHPATLFIDTPEGSLDIAYERRAGRMFGRFVEDGERLFMTANINTSRLLHELASTCGAERMKLVRMTDWTTLTAVQQEADADFEEAYAAIETALADGGS